jgi:phosphoribosylanthranilate isomerase
LSGLRFMLKTLVKVGRISHLSDARYCAGMGVEILGFDLNTGSPHYVTPQQFKEMTAWLSGVKTVGEVSEITPESLKTLLEDYPVDYIQAKYADWQSLVLFPVGLIVEINWQSDISVQKIWQQYAAFSRNISYFLIEKSGFLSPEEENEIRWLAARFPVLLSAEIQEEQLISLTEKSPFAGLALKSDVEEKPGFTNTDRLAEILEKLEM